MPFYLPWMSCYGSKRSCLLIFCAGDDSVKVPWKLDVGKCQNQIYALLLWPAEWKYPAPLVAGGEWVTGLTWQGSKNCERRNWHGLWGNRISKNKKSTHSKMPILFRCSSNPDDRRPSGFKIHFIAAKLQPPAQNLQIKVKKVKSLEWMEGTLKIARHQKLQMRSNAMDTMLILSRYKGNLPVPIVQFHFNISQTAVDHPPHPAPLPPVHFEHLFYYSI